MTTDQQFLNGVPLAGMDEDDFRAAIFDSDDVERELVHVPQWGKNGLTIELWALNGIERAAVYQKVKANKENPATFYGAILVKSAHYPPGHKNAGKLIFKPEDLGSLGAKNSAILDRLATIAARLSGMTQESVEEKKDSSETTERNDSTLN